MLKVVFTLLRILIIIKNTTLQREGAGYLIERKCCNGLKMAEFHLEKIQVHPFSKGIFLKLETGLLYQRL